MAKAKRRQMAQAKHGPASPTALVVRRILGDLDDEQVSRVIETGASETELQQASAALSGDLPGHIGRPIEGPAARVYDLLAPDSEDEEPTPRGSQSTEP